MRCHFGGARPGEDALHVQAAHAHDTLHGGKVGEVPNDVAIIGWDDSALTSLLTPTLSTLRIAKRELGATAMRILNQLMNGEQLLEDCHQIIKPELVLRQSTAVPSFKT